MSIDSATSLQDHELEERTVFSEPRQLPRTDDTVFGFTVGLYPAHFPALPDPAT